MNKNVNVECKKKNLIGKTQIRHMKKLKIARRGAGILYCSDKGAGKYDNRFSETTLA